MIHPVPGGDDVEETAEAGRADALPALAGGLAHDLNNVLSAVLMMVDLLAESCATDRQRSVLTALDESARRGVALGRQLLRLARGEENEETLFQPKYLLLDILKSARAILPARVAMSSQLPPDLLLVQGSPLRVYRILLDLCLDARAALAETGGELALTAWNENLDEISAALRPGSAPGPHVVLEVARSAGAATSDATAARAARACGGFAEAVRRPEWGLAWRIFLPAVPPEAPQPAPDELRRGAGELILVVESDAAAREAMAATLERHGYRTETGADGAEAVALFARDPGAVAAVVAAADLLHLDGPGVLRAVRKLRGDIPAVLTVTADDLAAEEGSPCTAVVLAKPFNGAALLAAVGRALVRG